jgi:hypothetical protein
MYALFGFALGAAVSALLRRTIGSIGLTLGLFVAVRFAIGGLWRLTFLPPLTSFTGLDFHQSDLPGGNSAVVNGPYPVDAAGHQVTIPLACYTRGSGVLNVACARAHGAVGNYLEYQPESRLSTFHLIEFGLFAVLTAALVAFVVLRVRANRAVT